MPAAKAALLTAFGAQTGLAGVRITWGGPTEEDDLAYEHIWLGRVVREAPEFVAIGQQKIDEDYTVEVVVQARKGGDNEQATEERLWALEAECEAAIRADLSLGGVLGQHWAEIGRAEQVNNPIPNEWVSRVTFTVRCRARI